MSSLANIYRPKTFADVVGQEGEVDVLRTMVEKKWRPPAIMLTGPFGTGKTTLARLITRALLCDKPNGIEPCGECDSCKSMDRDNNPNYTEIDSASAGLVDDIRHMKETTSYRSGSKIKVITYDESHMLSKAAQNALLTILEEGAKDVLFIFCTTEANRMLPTIQSRCIVLRLKLLTSGQIASRVRKVAELEGIPVEDKVPGLIGTYVRGHVRDSMILLGQLANTIGKGQLVTEDMTRKYLRLDQNDDIYKLLVESDRKQAMERLEALLCTYPAGELTERIGELLLNAYKLKIGYSNFTEVDQGWLRKVLESRADKVLDQAEQILRLDPDFSTIQLAMAAIARILIEADVAKAPSGVGTLRPGGGLGEPTAGVIPTQHRKPGR